CQQQGKDQPLQALQTEGGDGPTDAGNRVGAMVGGRVDLPEQGDAKLRVLHQQGFELAEVRIVPVQMIEQLNLRRLVALASAAGQPLDLGAGIEVPLEQIESGGPAAFK